MIVYPTTEQTDRIELLHKLTAELTKELECEKVEPCTGYPFCAPVQKLLLKLVEEKIKGGKV